MIIVKYLVDLHSEGIFSDRVITYVLCIEDNIEYIYVSFCACASCIRLSFCQAKMYSDGSSPFSNSVFTLDTLFILHYIYIIHNLLYIYFIAEFILCTVSA